MERGFHLHFAEIDTDSEFTKTVQEATTQMGEIAAEEKTRYSSVRR